MAMISVNPATGKGLATYETHDAAGVEERLVAATRAQEAWRQEPLSLRCTLLGNVARHLREEVDGYARLASEEMGKPIAEARAEVLKCALVCDHYREHAPAYLADAPVDTEARRAVVRFHPLGAILGVMPWNFPFWQVFRFAAPALAAGNVVILKHASNVPGCALALEEAFSHGGAPPGLFTTLLIPAGRVADLLADQRIAAVTLTGSESAGRSVAAAAGRALKKSVLELGGSDPFVVLADADLDACVEAAVAARNQNSGQSCIAAKRFILVEEISQAFTERLVAAMEALRVGDPSREETQLGPLARPEFVDELDRQVRVSLARGAVLLTGGEPLPREGYFYAPTVLSGTGRGMPVWDEETFGPVAALATAVDGEEAVALANQTDFGLGASLWTRDLALADRVADRIEAGSVFVNAAVKSDPRLPFGGVKRSGYGRELAVYGIREFVNVKTLWVDS